MTTQVCPAPTPCTRVSPFPPDKATTDEFRLANVRPAELSRASDPISEARKLVPSPRVSVSRSNEVRIPTAVDVRSVAGGAIGSGEHAETDTDITATTLIRTEDNEGMLTLDGTGEGQ